MPFGDVLCALVVVVVVAVVVVVWRERCEFAANPVWPLRCCTVCRCQLRVGWFNRFAPMYTVNLFKHAHKFCTRVDDGVVIAAFARQGTSSVTNTASIYNLRFEILYTRSFLYERGVIFLPLIYKSRTVFECMFIKTNATQRTLIYTNSCLGTHFNNRTQIELKSVGFCSSSQDIGPRGDKTKRGNLFPTRNSSHSLGRVLCTLVQVEQKLTD